ncbi:MAG: hypothetical protein KL863_05885 [Rhizobium sp.]|nr:hypothetical protein [Rhizobium sp.]
MTRNGRLAVAVAFALSAGASAASSADLSDIAGVWATSDQSCDSPNVAWHIMHDRIVFVGKLRRGRLLSDVNSEKRQDLRHQGALRSGRQQVRRQFRDRKAISEGVVHWGRPLQILLKELEGMMRMTRVVSIRLAIALPATASLLAAIALSVSAHAASGTDLSDIRGIWATPDQSCDNPEIAWHIRPDAIVYIGDYGDGDCVPKSIRKRGATYTIRARCQIERDISNITMKITKVSPKALSIDGRHFRYCRKG